MSPMPSCFPAGAGSVASGDWHGSVHGPFLSPTAHRQGQCLWECGTWGTAAWDAASAFPRCIRGASLALPRVRVRTQGMFPGFINRVLLQNKSRHNVTYYPWLLWQNWVGSYKRDLCPQPRVHIMGPVPEHVPTSVTGRGLSPLGNGLIRLMTQNPSVGGPGGVWLRVGAQLSARRCTPEHCSGS